MNSDCFGRFVAMFLAGSLIKLQITTNKKVQSSGHWLEINTESEYNSNLQIGMALGGCQNWYKWLRPDLDRSKSSLNPVYL